MTKSNQKNHLKNGKLKYLYSADTTVSQYPILGSCVRALGKGWRVLAITSDDNHLTFQSLKDMLTSPNFLAIHYVRDFQPDTFARLETPDVVLINSSPNSHQDGDLVKRVRDSFAGKCHIVVGGYGCHSGDFDLISQFSQNKISTGGITAFTGYGQGKSISAYGLALLDVFSGNRVAIVQWFKEKEGTWRINEHYFSQTLRDPELVEFHPAGLGFYGSPDMDRVSGEKAYQQHKDKAYKGVELAMELIDSGDYSCVVLDELLDTVPAIAENVQHPLIELNAVISLLKHCRESDVQVIVTGRGISDALEPLIRTSYSITQIRHPYSEKGLLAVSGLDF